jgi:predicted transcriptional regulator of viral defense system
MSFLILKPIRSSMSHRLRAEYDSNMKTLGSRAAQLITELNERRHATFTVADVVDITGLKPASARTLVHKAQTRGLITRLKPGLYNLVPFELGRATEHVGNPYLIARDLVASGQYFLSHGTALELHRMVTQPQLAIFVSTERRVRPQTIRGYVYRFIQIPSQQFFGITQIWVTKEQSVAVSDPERTIIDGLRHPAHVGGVTEIAKGLWMRREKLDVERLVDYTLRLDIGAVVRRLGFLLELYGLAPGDAIEPLRHRLSATYQRLDPLFPAKGPFHARWRLQLNVSAEELDAVRYG